MSIVHRKWLFSFTALTVLLTATVLSACGQSKPTNQTAEPKSQALTVAEIANYEGPDREKLLLEGAKKEGKLTLFTSTKAEDITKITEGFERKYGIKVEVWRAGADQIRQRILSEEKAGKNTFDSVQTSAEEMEALHREQMLQPVNSPYLKDLMHGAVFNHKEWTATFLSVFVQAYNTNKISKAELPKTYQDLLDPKWKGKLGIEATDYDWFFTVVKQMGEDKGLQLFKDMVAINGISVRKGHSLLNNMVVSGEVPLGLTVYNYMPEQSKQAGAPVDWFVIEPAIARPSGVAISKNAKNPYAAMLFYDYMITDAQKIFAELNYIPTTSKIESPLKNINVKLVDSATVLDESDKWLKVFEDILIKK